MKCVSGAPICTDWSDYCKCTTEDFSILNSSKLNNIDKKLYLDENTIVFFIFTYNRSKYFTFCFRYFEILFILFKLILYGENKNNFSKDNYLIHSI
jgi:hypothetical protein